MNEPTTTNGTETIEARKARDFTGLILSFIGLIVMIVGLKSEWFWAYGSPGIGFAQMMLFLLGLALISMGGFMSLNTIWKKEERSILADFGSRFIATGYVIAIFAGLSDHMGINVLNSETKLVYFGPWEEIGIEIGMIVIVIGLLMMIPYRHPKDKEKKTAS